MAFILPGLRRGLILSTPLLVATPLLFRQYNRPLLCDSPDPLTKITSDLKSSFGNNGSGGNATLTTSSKPSPSVVRQMSLGSILGVMGGLGVSVFSKPLAVLIGLGVVLIQFLESRGIHIIPYSYLQRRFQSTTLRSLVQENPAFKLTFGTTFALAAFASFNDS